MSSLRSLPGYGFVRTDSTWDWGSDDDPSGPSRVAAPWGEPEASGLDVRAALGNMFGPEPADPFGKGLAVSGIGSGGGGAARSIGLGASGHLGHGEGAAWGQGVGVSDPASRFNRSAKLGSHEPRAPTISTRVPPDIVARVLSRNSGRLRACLPASERALDGVDLELGVAVDGTRTEVSVERSPELSRATRACLERVASELRFLPAGGPSKRVAVRVHLR